MKRLRRSVLWLSLIMIGLLIVLSVLGAFLGAERAGAFFSSPPLAAFWVLLAGLLLAGLLSFKRLRRSPGLLALHLGPVLILLGAMYGSDVGHRLRAKIFNSRKIPSGYMAIFEGEASNRLLDRKLRREIGRLPFSLKLKDFSIEYYEPEHKRWLLAVVAPASGKECQRDEAGQMRQECQQPEAVESLIEWSVGRDVDIPHTGARLRVLKYLSGARPVYAAGAAPELEITQGDGKKMRVPAKAGQEVALAEPKAKLRIARVFSHLFVRGSGEQREVIDLPGPADNPALQVEIEDTEGNKQTRYVMPLLPMHRQGQDGVKLRYRFPEPVAAEAAPGSALPAMKLLLSYREKELEKWMVAREGDRYVRLSLGPLLGLPDAAETPHGDSAGAPALYMFKPTGQIKDFKSDLLVLEEGEAVARKVIEVNKPLPYGGYHFYQHSYDNQNGRYTVLLVKCDSGLWLVYAGFLLLCAGVFGRCWGKSALAYLRKQRNNGS